MTPTLTELARTNLRIKSWLFTYGESYAENTGGCTCYSDWDMIDGAMHDLDLPEESRKAVRGYVDEWIDARTEKIEVL